MNDLAWSYRSKWKEIGIKLGIDVGTLDAIEKDYSKCNECLSEMNKTWLRGNKLLPYPTRSAMIMALKTLGMSIVELFISLKPTVTLY